MSNQNLDQSVKGITAFIAAHQSQLQYFPSGQLADILESYGFEYMVVRSWENSRKFQEAK